MLELVEAYEAKHHAIDVSDLTGLEMLKFVLEQAELSASDLGRLLNMHPTMGSKILKSERRLTWDHAKILAARFKVAPAIFMD
jgi:antitoxin component HigA of HigAB toxin-antitoxin module